jgi:hypothetical protein
VEIAAARLVGAGPEAVFAFLSNLKSHWVLGDRFVELLNSSCEKASATAEPSGCAGRSGCAERPAPG